jgi:Na+/H+ antiporter NhaD/arsenite permease-like protein
MTTTPLLAVLPFAIDLLGIAIVPLTFGRFWERNRNKLLVALVVSAPVVVYLASAPGGAERLARTLSDYLSFMALLAALFTIAGGICLRGALVGSTAVNTALLAAGALLGSAVGTMGASVLLIRPLLRANERRAHAGHVVVFFIFIVSNASGLLTPLGPPLFLGFLHGVPFTWTVRLAPQWALVSSALLAIFAVVDRLAFALERRAPAAREAAAPVPLEADATGPLRLEGALNLAWLGVLVGLVFFVGTCREGTLRTVLQIAGPLVLAGLSFKTTPARIHELNRLSFAPLLEVGAIFVGVFVTMVPAISFLAERGAALGITKPWQFFWAAGALSSVLDNAPTYLTFASLATGVVNGLGGAALPPGDLGALAAHPIGSGLLAAVSCGAVFMGAATYIGNGPNFMVKAIAEQHGVRMPSFFGFIRWSVAILFPLLGIVAYLFF